MWEALAQIAISLGIKEASSLVDRIRTLKPHQAASLANQIIAAAEKKGSRALNKAAEAISNIPMLAGSPEIKAALIQARRNAQENYNNVEAKVIEMKNNANAEANKVSAMGDQGAISTTIDDIKTGKTAYRRAEDKRDEALNNINNFNVEQTI